jgi:hypothetical protein
MLNVREKKNTLQRVNTFDNLLAAMMAVMKEEEKRYCP